MTTPPLDLDAIERVCAEATPGPWVGDDMSGVGTLSERGITTTICQMRWDGTGADEAFVINARTWVPALVARVRELEATAMAERVTVAAEARQDEREACAKLAEEIGKTWGQRACPPHEAAADIAAAFRGRKP